MLRDTNYNLCFGGSFVMERVWKPNVEISPPTCPRCGSSNTKFCYYNNYSLTQPRYFCKGCKRYWTRGGSLRNIPIGGGCRKSRRGKFIGVSTDRVSTRTLAHGNNNIGLDHSGTSSSSNGPNIDLALVYNNFLNQNQEPERVELPELPSDVDLSIEFANLNDMNLEFSTHLPLENGSIVQCPNLSEKSIQSHLNNFNAMYNCGFQLVHQSNQEEMIKELACNNHTMINYGLPPLPGEDQEASQELGWLNHRISLGTDRLLNATQMPGIELEVPEPEPEPEPDQFIGDKGNFDFSSSYGNFFLP